MGAGGVGIEDKPSINVTRKEVAVRDSGDAPVEFEVARADILPIRIVLVKPVVLATNFDGVPAVNECKDIRNKVAPLSQDSRDVTVFVATSAQSDTPGSISSPGRINLDFRKHIRRSVGPVGWLKPNRRRIVFVQRGRRVLVELAAG